MTGDEGTVSWSDARDVGREECKPLEVSMCNMLLGSAVGNKGLYVTELWHVDSKAPICNQDKEKGKRMRKLILCSKWKIE